MKKHLLTALAVLLSLHGFSQTKGTSALSLGISSYIHEFKDSNLPSDQINKSTSLGTRLGYGLFVADNSKVGIELIYNQFKQNYNGTMSYNKTKGYGAAINYQRYFPLVKTFYAFAGGGAQYVRSKSDNKSDISSNNFDNTNTYTIDASGGLAWFISKRWALETQLLSTGFYYTENEYGNVSDNRRYSTKQTNFSLSSDGIFNNLGFKVYLMF
jgi:hypothetical protein